VVIFLVEIEGYIKTANDSITESYHIMVYVNINEGIVNNFLFCYFSEVCVILVISKIRSCRTQDIFVYIAFYNPII